MKHHLLVQKLRAVWAAVQQTQQFVLAEVRPPRVQLARADHATTGGAKTQKHRLGIQLAVPSLAALLLVGCASSYQLTLMPRTSGKLYYGEAVEQPGSSQAAVSITIEDKTYAGNWVLSSAERTTSYIGGGFGWGFGRGGIGIGTAPVIVENPNGGEAKALLQAPDGSGLRCDFKGLGSGRQGSGLCQDDKGLQYDVQIRLKDSE